MNKAELESKHLSDLHAMAAGAGVERYRMLTRAELIETLAEGGAEASEPATERERRPAAEPPPREEPDRRSTPRRREEPRREEPEHEPEPARAAAPAEQARPRRRRRRRFGRRNRESVTIQSLLLPPQAGRQTILYADSREACTALLRGVAAELADESKGPDPVVLLIDPSPEELADWKREAPQAEIVAAGQPRHAADALAAAASRSGDGDDVFLLIDSLTRLAAAYGEADAAKEFFDAGRAQGATGGGSLTVVAALERPT